jgi:hypothetical protein
VSETRAAYAVGQGAPSLADMLTSEAGWQRCVTDLCDVLGLPWYHANQPQRDRGGFPDLVIVQPPFLRLWELKSQRGRLRPGQAMFLEELARCDRLDVRVLRPGDWQAVVQALTQPR